MLLKLPTGRDSTRNNRMESVGYPGRSGKMRISSVVWAILTLSLYACICTLSILMVVNRSLAQTAGDYPVPPNFWDPRATTEETGVPPETIQFLATDDYPPFSFRDSTGRLTGFNIDLARAICEELNSACSMRIKSFDALIPALMREEGDAIIAGLAPTEANLKTMRFSDTYVGLPARFVTLRDKEVLAIPEELDGETIAVVAGTLHERFLQRFFTLSDIVSYETREEARAALMAGKAKVYFGDGLSLSFWLNGAASQDCCEFAGGPWLEPGYFDRGLAIAFRADDILRQRAIDDALRRLQAKGTYSELYLRYFPISFY